MQVDEALSLLADRYGLISAYHDLNGVLQEASPDTTRALLRSMGLVLECDADVRDALRVTEARQSARIIPAELILLAGQGVQIPIAASGEWVLHFDPDLGLEPGEGSFSDLVLIPNLPVGVHRLALRIQAQTQSVTLLAKPNGAPSLRAVTGHDRLWGVTAALYGMHSARSVGLGDFADLAVAAEGLAKGGAAFLGINPIHNLGWADATVISPYSPSTREFLNPWHLALDQLRGLQDLAQAQKAIAEAREVLRPIKPEASIDYAAFRLQFKPLLRKLYDLFTQSEDAAAQTEFARYRSGCGQRMQDFALFEALSVQHGADWRQWPAFVATLALARQSKSVAQDEVAFHIWLQWQAEHQLGAAQTHAIAAGMPLGLYLDLAVGARPGGAETWCDTGSVAAGATLGAPPDQFNPTGQRWNLTAFAPNKLRDTAYADVRRILAASMRFAGVLRIDHVLGMNRSYLFPDCGAPGGYVRQPFPQLLAVAAIEAAKSGTVVIGEDLGLVPDGFREALSDHGFYGYSVLQYERDAQGQFRQSENMRAQSLTCFGTHDSPSMRGFYTGHDIGLRQQMGWSTDDEAHHALQARQADIASVGGDANFETFRHNVHARIAWSPAAMISVQLDDMLGITEPQNLPGTVDEYPNWRTRCPITVDQIALMNNLTDTSEIMRESGRKTPQPQKSRDIG